MREIRKDEVEVRLDIEQEETPIEGNVMASDDDAVDARAEQWVREQLRAGNDAAWCAVLVTVSWRVPGTGPEDLGFVLTGRDSLGCCSYASVAEIESTLVPEMVDEALADLNANVAVHLMRADAIRAALKD